MRREETIEGNLEKILISAVAVVSIVLVIIIINSRVAVNNNSDGDSIPITDEVEKENTSDEEKEMNQPLAEETFSNPVFEPVLADPSIIRGDDGYFYAYGTEDDWSDGRGARYVPIIRSDNLVDWEFVANAFEESIDWKEGWIWAPDIVEYNDKYYLYYSVSTWGDTNPAIGVATSDSLEGPFEDHGKVTDTVEMDGYSIDPMFYVEDGIPYLFFGGITSGIYAVELTQDGLSMIGESMQVIGKGYEAPYFIKRNDYYYFFGSGGSCCDGVNSTYHVHVGRSESLLGPYENEHGQDMKRNRGKALLYGDFPVERNQEHVVGPGHNAVIEDDAGDDWLVYHGMLADKTNLPNGVNRRALFIDPINWVDDWPEINNTRPNINAQKVPYINNE